MNAKSIYRRKIAQWARVNAEFTGFSLKNKEVLMVALKIPIIWGVLVTANGVLERIASLAEKIDKYLSSDSASRAQTDGGAL